MGLALDESENTTEEIIRENEIDIILDTPVRQFSLSGLPITVDYQDTPYGSGFIINNGSRC